MRKAIDVFGDWAEKGKDRGMEKTHAIPVDEMISFALKERLDIGKNFSFLDLGCGIGWFANLLSYNFNHVNVTGIDFNPVAIDFANKVKDELKLKTNFIVKDLFKVKFYNKFEKYDLEKLLKPNKD